MYVLNRYHDRMKHFLNVFFFSGHLIYSISEDVSMDLIQKDPKSDSEKFIYFPTRFSGNLPIHVTVSRGGRDQALQQNSFLVRKNNHIAAREIDS